MEISMKQLSRINELWTASNHAFDAAIDTVEDGPAAESVAGLAEQCSELYEQAIQSIVAERLSDAVACLEAALRLEIEYGDGQHARAALKELGR